ncbi:MAG: protein translocase subunit SecDF [Flavobacteriales bacterium]|nr:protein translocase subunit SecDF [Flavobacteriales bacterium]
MQGGMNVTLEVSLVDLIKVLGGTISDQTINAKFEKTIARALDMQRNSQDDYVTLFGKAWDEVAPGEQLTQIFHNLDNKDLIPRTATNDEVLAIISKEAADAVDRTEQVLRKRIDNLGVVQPKVQKLGADRILVELPGVKDPERVEKILIGTAKLEFWETYENEEVYGKLVEINELLKKEAKLAEAESDTDVDTTNEVAVNEPDANDADIDADTTDENSLAALLAGDSTGADTTLAGDVQGEANPLFDLMSPAYYNDQNGQSFLSKGSGVGYVAKKDTAAVMKLLKREDIRAFLPNTKLLWEAKPLETESGDIFRLHAIKVTNRDGTANIEGDVVTDARSVAGMDGKPEISLSMDTEGSRKWKLLTGENIGKSVAIVLDNLVYSAPTVQSEIAGGQTSISGKFTVEETEDLANILKAGKLPAPSKIIEKSEVGPTLGEENINAGLMSFGIALVLILIYMIFYYAKAGSVADLALVVNMLFIVGVLASLGATLTLPGIAGIVLTIGMSVDANVIIFERIREELREGKGMRLAIKDGYNNAKYAIFDANVTTLFTAGVLMLLGSGPVKGFAVTLFYGILTSLFTAWLLTRLIFEWQLNRKKEISFSTKLTQNWFTKVNFNFVGKRKFFYTLSALIVAMGFVSLAIRGLDYGVDFSGGRSYQVKFESPVNVNDVSKNLGDVFVENGTRQPPEVKTKGSDNVLLITTKYLINSPDINVGEQVESKLDEGLGKLGVKYEQLGVQMVGPTIADDIKTSAVWAMLFSLLIIFLYIVFRFKRWQFGLGALIAMFHDVIVVLAVFSIFYGIIPFSLEVDQAFIAAILTVIGYSINDTVVVFDRIREYIGKYKKQGRKEVINRALNSTLSRTVNTSLSTFVVLLMIFLFGSEAIKGFTFALMVGVAVGTYSSLCIATPVVVDLGKDDNIDAIGKASKPKKKEALAS